MMGKHLKAITLTAACFAAFSLAVHVRALDRFDVVTTTWANSIGIRPVDWLMTIVTALMSPEISLLLLGIICIVLRRRFGWRAAAWLLGVFTVATLVELVLKNIVYQPPPHGVVHRFMFREGLIHFSLPYAYPSGHSLRALLLTGAVALWVMPRAAIACWTLGGLIAASRVYLGCHWMTDVLGGALLAMTSLLVVQDRIRSRGAASAQAERVTP